MNGWELGLLFAAWLAAVAFLRAYRVWLPYYVLGVAGFAYWLALSVHAIPSAELLLTHSVAFVVHVTSNAVGLPTRMFEGAPGTLLVLIVTQDVGWTVLRVGVESSALLEMSVLVSLLLFYPGWSHRWRVQAIALGLLATWIGNVVRMLVVVAALHWLGKNALLLAHTVVSKVFFFGLTIGIYWYLLTLPTLRDVRHLLQRRQFAS
ncbi:MAG: hypothetical protein D6791_10420 [Chloroflexi bacterium]|nr:MAG: hypothetical protein D6791_10420 [Chloroflexota bacterium]